MLDRKDNSFKKFAEDFGKFKEMIHRYDFEHRDEIIKEQGKEMGRAKVRDEFIKSMYTEGIPLEQIANIIKIPIEEVKYILSIE